MKSNENGKTFLIHGNLKSNFVFSCQTFFIAKILENVSTLFVSRVFVLKAEDGVRFPN
jgi:hypothetical protein